MCDTQKKVVVAIVIFTALVLAVYDVPVLNLDSETKNINTFKSLCSPKSDKRGSGQRVISFTIFGMIQDHYFDGIAANLEQIRKLYPKYIMRLYFNSREIPKESRVFGKLLDLEQSNKEYFDICNVKDVDSKFSGMFKIRVTDFFAGSISGLSESFGMIWRFAPMADPLVQEFHSRDLDVVPIQREVEAVNDWLRTPYHYHIMRDHFGHTMPIMGGMWGFRTGSRKIQVSLY